MIGTKPVPFNSLIFNPFQPNKFLIHSIMDNRGNQLKNIGNYVILGSIGLVIVLDLGNRDGGALIFLLLLIVGFLGAMTTFSAFSLDTLLLFQQGHYNTALFYIFSSVTACLFAAYAGMQITRVAL